MAYVLGAFLVSLVVSLLLVRHRRLRLAGADSDTTSVQKYHANPVPRTGGIALLLAMIPVFALAAFRDPEIYPDLIILLVCALPVFLGGLGEDLFKNVRVLVRLGLALTSGAMVYWWLGAGVTRVNVIGLDYLLGMSAVSFVFTIFTIAGAANAINIIDGYNGLAAVVSGMILAGLGYVAFYLGDRLILVAAVGMLGALGGFLIWNYPRGLLFLGDGGAYFIGYMIGSLAVIMLARHPQVSAWFPLLLCIYPVFETLFSIYRKKFVRGTSPGAPDGVHLHMLVYKRLVRWAVGSQEAHLITERNAMTSPYLWVLSSMAVIPAVLFWQYQIPLIICTVLFAFSYVVLYRTLVLFRMPKWLVVQKKNRD
jgi:UDP-N-acetylmuramyl pentapeptide phosphotransferase/UDP-N-acetylglucosamine-1-phosphate transferase